MVRLKYLIFFSYTVSLFLSANLCYSEVNPTLFANGKVVSVQDGDTITIKTNDNQSIKIRFYGIDCPESKWEGHWDAQPYSKEAKEFVSNIIFGKTVSVRLKDDETYGRVIGEVFYDGKSLSRELAREGLTWWNKKYEPHDLDIKRLAERARKNKKGLWKDDSPVPPWRHRH